MASLRRVQGRRRDARESWSGRLSSEPRDDDVADHGAHVTTGGRVLEVDFEEVTERVRIGDLEDAVGADHQMHIDGIDVAAKLAQLTPTLQDAVQQGLGGRGESADRREAPDELAAVNVFDRDQTDEGAMRHMVIEGQLGEMPYRDDRIRLIDVDLLLCCTDTAIGLFEDGEIQLLLTAEVVVDHSFRRAGALGDVVHAGAGVPLLGEDLGGNGQELGPGSLCISLHGCHVATLSEPARTATRQPTGRGNVPYGTLPRVRTSIATVCLSGALAEKLHAAAAAGFDGVEIFEPDLVAAPESPEEIRALAARLGLTLDLYQPMRDVEGVDEDAFLDVLRRAEAKFALMQRLGMGLMLCCSNVATATVDDDEVSAAQLRRLGELAGSYGVRIAFEALAWGRFVDDYRRAWRIVELADHPAVGVCLDSFHVLSRGHDPAAIEQIPSEKVFFLQLADAAALSMDVLSWSRHHRLFPGEGTFDLARFVTHVLRAGYTGPLSLEVFNDTFRQTDAHRTAVHARRSLRWLEDVVARRLGPAAPAQVCTLPDIASPRGFDFIEVKAEDTSSIAALLQQAGFTSRGRHRSKPVSLWSAGGARVILSEQHARALTPHLAAFGFAVDDPIAVTTRARELGTPLAYRRTLAHEQSLDAAIAPDGTEIYWTRAVEEAEPAWVDEFEHGDAVHESPVRGVDHVSLTQPWQVFDESVLFYTSVFGLDSAGGTEVASPHGLVQSRVIRSRTGGIRIPLNVVPPIVAQQGHPGGMPRHVAFWCTDVVELARAARARGLDVLPIPSNYYEDLEARLGLDAATIAQFRSLDLVFDRDGDAEYLQFYTKTTGQIFFEFVERRGGYDGFGAGNAPVRLSAQGAGNPADSVRE